MRLPRDTQQSRVYKWERGIAGYYGAPEFQHVDECTQWLKPVWRTERGRYGRTSVEMPELQPGHWGQRRAIAHHDHRISLPKWARRRTILLHEMAHRLTPRDEAHGPRFVGVLIGLLARHLDYDAHELMRLADEAGVKYHARSIGAVPVHGPAWHVERTLRTEGAMTGMDLACHLSIACGVDINVRQVRGAAVHLIRVGKARWLRGKLRLLENPTS